jgi:hypothetical protein
LLIVAMLPFFLAMLWISSCAGSRSILEGECLHPGKNPRVKDIKTLQREGARPRFSPSGQLIVFDRKNRDGYYDVYLTDLQGNVICSLTDGKEGIGQRSNGNAVFYPEGGYVIFLSEEEGHYLQDYSWSGDPGIGLFCNLWASDLEGNRFFRLTNLPIKRSLADKTPVMAITNPLFSPDGTILFWTERYDEGGHNNWGKWRIKAADFVVENGVPGLRHERTILAPQGGNYVTAMGFLNLEEMVVAGNLDGQHEYGMDQYVYNLATGELSNLTRTPEYWEEDSSVTPAGKIIYMSNEDSRYKFNFDDPHWQLQPMEREYYIMNEYGGGKERLTYFNDPTAPEYMGRKVLAVAADVSPDGRMLAATIGEDYGETERNVVLKIVLVEFTESL